MISRVSRHIEQNRGGAASPCSVMVLFSNEVRPSFGDASFLYCSPNVLRPRPPLMEQAWDGSVAIGITARFAL